MTARIIPFPTPAHILLEAMKAEIAANMALAERMRRQIEALEAKRG